MSRTMFSTTLTAAQTTFPRATAPPHRAAELRDNKDSAVIDLAKLADERGLQHGTRRVQRA
jgi:hypothetical protein